MKRVGETEIYTAPGLSWVGGKPFVGQQIVELFAGHWFIFIAGSLLEGASPLRARSLADIPQSGTEPAAIPKAPAPS